MDLEMFELVLLRGPATAPELPDTELERLQEAHLAHLSLMRRQGYIRVAGPIVISPCVRAPAESDPSVRSGRLAVEVMTFYCPRGDIVFGNHELGIRPYRRSPAADRGLIARRSADRQLRFIRCKRRPAPPLSGPGRVGLDALSPGRFRLLAG
jgi:hypothetical protein